MTEPTDENTDETPARPPRASESTLPPAAAADYEGPRRRAREEREERRAVQARAIAIEERPPRGQTQGHGRPAGGRRKGLARRTVRGREGADVVGAVVKRRRGRARSCCLLHTIMSARDIVVIGLGAVTQDEVIAAAAVPPGTPLLQVEIPTQFAERVAAIRRGPGARVSAELLVDAARHRHRTDAGRGRGLSGLPALLFDKDGSGFRLGAAAGRRALPRRRKPRAQ